MSIFKETFPKYVRTQLDLRKKILSRGNDGGSRFLPIIETREVEGEGGVKTEEEYVALDPAAFYTLTTSKQCIIRMASGVDLRMSQKYKVLEPAEIRYMGKPDSLARQYILEGGNRFYDNKGKQGGIREGFTTGKPEDDKVRGFSYGDLNVRANAGDGYGVVPMPGITSAEIRTKTAYGSLREAKVNFECHNKRQLDILELLYMRPGFPILLEWGWNPFINNKGRREEYFPFLNEFFEKTSTYEKINKIIRDRRKTASGNYDGFMGYCKNFDYKTRDDGGFSCTTEIIAMGEALSGVKGKKTYNINSANATATTKDLKERDDFLSILDKPFSEKMFRIIRGDNETYEDPLEAGITADEKKKRLQEIAKQVRGFIVNRQMKTFAGEETVEFVEDEKDKFTNFYSWDLIATLLNKFVLHKTNNKNNMMKIVWFDEGGPDSKVKHRGRETYTAYSKFRLGVNLLVNDIDVNSALDGSVDPSVCVLAHEFFPYIGKKNSDLTMQDYYPIARDKDGLGYIKLEDHEDFKDGKIAYIPDNYRAIGKIFFNRDFIRDTYDKMKYGDKSSGFNIYDFLKEIWEKKANQACGGTHEFVIHQNSTIDSTEIKIIDLNFDSDYLLDKKDGKASLFEITPFGNESICRDFSYTSNVPSALGATMAIAAQAPDDIDSLDKVTFNQFNKKTKNRFTLEPEVTFKDDEKAQFKLEFNEMKRLLGIIIDELSRYKSGFNQGDDAGKILNGMLPMSLYGRISVEYGKHYRGGGDIEISKKGILDAIGELESILLDISMRYNEDDKSSPPKYFLGYPRDTKPVPKKSAIIPLKFNGRIDGIGGIVIGNVFKINKDYLPIGYEKENVGFIVMGERQKITDGQDWTTDISGQLILLNDNASTRQTEDVAAPNNTVTINLNSTDLLTGALYENALNMAATYYNFNQWLIENGRNQKYDVSIEGLAAFIGNAIEESGLRPDAIESGNARNYYKHLDENRRTAASAGPTVIPVSQKATGGVGIMQWTGPRREEFELEWPHLIMENDPTLDALDPMRTNSRLNLLNSGTGIVIEGPNEGGWGFDRNTGYSKKKLKWEDATGIYGLYMDPNSNETYGYFHDQIDKKSRKIPAKFHHDQYLKVLRGCYAWRQAGNNGYLRSNNDKTIPPNKQAFYAGLGSQNWKEGYGIPRYTYIREPNPYPDWIYDNSKGRYIKITESNAELYYPLGRGVTGGEYYPECKVDNFSHHLSRVSQMAYYFHKLGDTKRKEYAKKGGADVAVELTKKLWGDDVRPRSYVCRPESEGGPKLVLDPQYIGKLATAIPDDKNTTFWSSLWYCYDFKKKDVNISGDKKSNSLIMGLRTDADRLQKFNESSAERAESGLKAYNTLMSNYNPATNRIASEWEENFK